MHHFVYDLNLKVLVDLLIILDLIVYIYSILAWKEYMQPDYVSRKDVYKL